MFLKVVCSGVEDGKGNEMVSLGEEGDERMGVNIFLAGGFREEVLVIKEEVESVEKKHRSDAWC